MKTKRKEIDMLNLSLFGFEQKIKRNDLRPLVEAFRRKHFLGAEDKFMGLGTPSQYKSSLFTPSFGTEVKRANNWYMLSNEGKMALTQMESYFIIPKSVNMRNAINQILFNFK